MPRFVERAIPDGAGVVDASELPHPLPYGLTPIAFFRTVEDVQEVIYQVNTMLHGKQYQRLEELLDPAGFSGMVSRTVVDRLARASHSLVMNKWHNGYPDLLVEGQYPADAVQHGEGGFEVKASRYEKGWQTHGPRAGWFCVAQFSLDARDDVALFNREPTQVVAMLVAELTLSDWSWQPAKAGKIRSGTASLRASGVAKLRAGAVWVAPQYREEHLRLLAQARADTFAKLAPELVRSALRAMGKPATVTAIAAELEMVSPLDMPGVLKRVASVLATMKKKGLVDKSGQGATALWALTAAGETEERPPQPQIPTEGPESELLAT